MNSISQKSKDIIEYRKKYPCLTLQAIGDKFDVTRERVRQILDMENIETKSTEYHKYAKYGDIKIVCSQCRKIFTLNTSNFMWGERNRMTEHRFCSTRCHGKWMHYRKIITQYNDGVSLKDIAKYHHVKVGSIGMILDTLRKRGFITTYRTRGKNPKVNDNKEEK